MLKNTPFKIEIEKLTDIYLFVTLIKLTTEIAFLAMQFVFQTTHLELFNVLYRKKYVVAVHYGEFDIKVSSIQSR